MNKFADEIRALGDDAISRQVNETQHEMFNLRFRLATRQLDDSNAIGRARKKLARLKTIQTERRLAAEAEARKAAV
ncbi:MAG: 50S ribosomal protein L29 [Dehalococcoidia bacterium]